MAEPENPSPGRVALPLHLYTFDEERIEHIISDELMMQLANGGRDVSLQISIGALGVAVGFFQNFLGAAIAVQGGVPLNPLQGVAAAIFVVAVTVFIVAGLYYRRIRGGVDSLMESIRNRKVGVMAEPPFAGGAPFPSGDPSSIATDTSSTTE